jgi:16S rRNA A1518/A1519 N6-dimethyltransferase RsmA/KsgA/DIM1 with predicted DNA glycosylase/AP lyase activity
LFSTFIKQSFSQRRKKLKNNLPQTYNAGLLDKWADMRPEEISPSEFVQIFNTIYLG